MNSLIKLIEGFPDCFIASVVRNLTFIIWTLDTCLISKTGLQLKIIYLINH